MKDFEPDFEQFTKTMRRADNESNLKEMFKKQPTKKLTDSKTPLVDVDRTKK